MKQMLKTFRGKKVFVTGHTGFKGSWICEWLLTSGAEVWGYGLEPATNPSLFEKLGLGKRLHHQVGDIRDSKSVARAIATCNPDIVFHLAAQPLVRLSYQEPVETYSANVMGTVHVLDGLRQLSGPCAAIFITTDKCYENIEKVYAYRESDQLGGRDPYSSSKAAAEITISAYRRSFFPPDQLLRGKVPPVAVASARAGNVVGGGDWADDRLIPDCVRALARGEAIEVRNPESTRPWQHVLEPLAGYITLAAQLHSALLRGSEVDLVTKCSAFNFGPLKESNRSVRDVVEEVIHNWPGQWIDRGDPNAVHEAAYLSLSIEKAHRILDWKPRWRFETTIAETVKWYRSSVGISQEQVMDLTCHQIAAYEDTPLQGDAAVVSH